MNYKFLVAIATLELPMFIANPIESANSQRHSSSKPWHGN